MNTDTDPDEELDDSDSRGRVEVRHEGTMHIGVAVVQAVSAATDVPVDAMEVDLNDVVDPDALNHLFADRLDGRPRTGGHVSFSMLDCRVRVNADGRIVVVPE